MRGCADGAKRASRGDAAITSSVSPGLDRDQNLVVWSFEAVARTWPWGWNWRGAIMRHNGYGEIKGCGEINGYGEINGCSVINGCVPSCTRWPGRASGLGA
jgi:hypothetical protein